MPNTHYSPLRYPGGKTKIAPSIKKILDDNELHGCDYIEPFAGGAGAGLSLLINNTIASITINDSDRSIYSFWYSAIFDSGRLCDAIENVSVDIETWEQLQLQQLQQHKSTADIFDLGFSTFYLNRTNVSGVIGGGVIGGRKQNGYYKMDVRFNKPKLIKKIQKIADYKNKIKVTCVDAVELLKSDIKDAFVYLDPPYVEKAKSLYRMFYKTEDHKRLADVLLSDESVFNWVLSYDNNKLIDNLYSEITNNVSYNLRYSLSNNHTQEYLLASDNLKVL